MTEELGAYAASVSFDRLPAEVRERARTLLWNQLSLSLASHSAPLVETTSRMAIAEGHGATRATVLHGGAGATPTSAAFANAVLFHVRVQDDTHGTAHLGTATIAAGLAAAELRGCTGAELMAGIVCGYEVGGVLNRAYGVASTLRGFRATGIYGVLAAAATASRVLGLSAQETSHAIGIAASFAGGLIEPFGAGSEEFPLQNGMAARNGLHAALLAQGGVRAAASMLDGRAGLLAAFAGRDEDLAAAPLGLGERFAILDVNLKPLPVCAGNQVPVMNAARVRERLGGSHIGAVEIRMNPYEARHPGIDNPGPFRTRTQTLMSTQYCVALALLGRSITLDSLERVDDSEIAALVSRCRVVADPGLAMLESVIRVSTAEGRIVEEHLRVSDATWRPAFDEVTDRALALAREGRVDASVVVALAECVAEIEDEPSVGRLASLAAV